MKSRFCLLTSLLFVFSIALGQKNERFLKLRSGTLKVQPGLTTSGIDSLNKKILTDKRAFILIQFDGIPSALERQELLSQGVQLLDYIPDNAYTATINRSVRVEALTTAQVKGLYQLSPSQKMDAALSSGLWPSYAIKVKGFIDVWASFPKSVSAESMAASIEAMGIEILSKEMSAYNVIVLRVAANRIFQLAEQPFIEFVAAAPPPLEILNTNSRVLSGASLLNTSLANGGKGLNGEGIVVGVGDNADIQTHVDFSGRLINRNAARVDFHGTHTTATVAGAGIINELYRGYLPKATIISQFFDGILINAPTYVNDYNMVISNNSYGAAIGCEYNGVYNLSSNILDKQAFDYPYLQHVFAAGNSGNITCAPFPPGFKTVLGGYQSSKNTISVGNTNSDYVLFPSSSKGPVIDGRLKPDLTALGAGVTSAWQTNTYAPANGTSISAPAVSGGLGLLYQRYRQLNGNNDPKSALMKAILCNGAEDKGNAGPDFKYGFGSMNLIRSIDMLEASHYFSGNLSNGTLATHPLTIPANTAEVKVMLYWHDPAASILASKALVNDLDLELVTPSGTVLPFLLDPTPQGVNNVAVQAADHTNNMEQVSLKNPASGSYTIRVKGTAIPQNPSQEYFAVYDVIPNSILLTYPAGEASLVPGESIRISWDAYGDDATTFSLQYSIDGGTVWNDIANNVAATSDAYAWQVPAVVSSNALVKIIKNTTGQSSTGSSFTIIGTPAVSLSSTQCEEYTAVEWLSVPGAANYEVMMLKGSEMVRVGTTPATSFNIENLSRDSVYWIAVRSLVGAKWGRRSVAISRQPNTGTCDGSISDGDLKIASIVMPVNGRKFTSSELGAATIIKAEIKNLDNSASGGFTIKYSVDGEITWTSENVLAAIAPGGAYTHTFATPANFSGVGLYHLAVAVTNNDIDLHTANDTLRVVISHLANHPISLSTPFLDDIETATSFSYSSKATGLAGLDRYDFENATSLGRLRTFVNSGISFSGSKALTMDVKAQSASNNVNYVTATYNLSSYNANMTELRLDFQSIVHGLNKPDFNTISIRGSDTGTWILMSNLFDAGATPGKYILSPSLEIGDSLVSHGQNFSSSFQVRWSQNGNYSTTQKSAYSGTSIDDIKLYEVFNDAQLKSIDGLAANNCALATTPITISVHNGGNTDLNNVPVHYSINGGSWVSEVIALLPGNATVQYSFTNGADLSLIGVIVIEAVVTQPADNFRNNDTARISIRNVPLISSFPYLQNFETDDGKWFSGGIKNNWQYGTPASPKINKAASGQKAWKTNLSGNYENDETAYLYSPCFNTASMSKPTLSFSVALDLEDCGTTICDAAWVEFSTNGLNWTRLSDNSSSGTNWYNATSKPYWSVQNYTRWHVATVNLPTGLNSVRLRFVLASDPGLTREGIAIDDIHIYDNTKGIYNGLSLSSPITQSLSAGSNWVDFEKDGALIASILPGTQNPGNTAVHAFINPDPVRNTGTQYYHDRSFTITAANNSFTDSVGVRIYFLENETENLLNATSCPGCSKPASAYGLGVSKYDDHDPIFENGNINDNVQGLWNHIDSDKAVKVPFDKGYYAEFKINGFSEFWLSNEALGGGTILPVKLLEFTVSKDRNDATIKWILANEINVSRFEIEVARGKNELLSNQFHKIGEVTSLGNTVSKRSYNFTDREPLKTGSRYYRLKTVDNDGSFSYSKIRLELFDNDIKWEVAPNPSTGLFYFIHYLKSGERADATLTDISGRIVKRYTLTGNSSGQKLKIDLSQKLYAPGVYLLHVHYKGNVHSEKLYKR